jgi:hypothetical protein
LTSGEAALAVDQTSAATVAATVSPVRTLRSGTRTFGTNVLALGWQQAALPRPHIERRARPVHLHRPAASSELRYNPMSYHNGSLWLRQRNDRHEIRATASRAKRHGCSRACQMPRSASICGDPARPLRQRGQHRRRAAPAGTAREGDIRALTTSYYEVASVH